MSSWREDTQLSPIRKENDGGVTKTCCARIAEPPHDIYDDIVFDVRYHMTDPNDVTSPRARWRLIAVLFCSDQKEDGWSLAVGQWDGKSRLAIRWNGNRQHPKGNPISRGQPTWFIVPEQLEASTLEGAKIPQDKRALATALLGHN
jgi:hypothetical protein